MARLDHIDRPVARVVASGSEEAVYRDRAHRLGLPFAAVVRLAPNAPASTELIARGTFAMSGGAGRPAWLAPDEEKMASVETWLAAHPGARPRLSVTTPTAIRAALRRSGANRFAAAAITRLESVDPHFSARRIATAPEIGVAIGAFALIAFALRLAPATTVIILNIVAAAFFLGVTILRFIAASLVPDRLPAERFPHPAAPEELPVYTVLVPLLNEAHIVPQLIAALDRIAWPDERLDVKLIVEADDRPTREAVERAAPGAPYEIVVVPAGSPRTKPKALQFAMTFARGAYVTIYDAEDLPHPHQLAEAFARFRRSDSGLACLQAPIAVDNPDDGLIARLFAIEYSALFDGLLPALAALRMPLPLGGTSNHFRREALERVGGWDPFNLTEDADLGVRLARFGYRSEMLQLPTFEEAPASLLPWVRQRTRWFKGWMQTWLVHMRRPVRLVREIGIRQFVGFNLIGAGMLVSALIHPLYLAMLLPVLINPLALWEGGDFFSAGVVGLNLFNLGAGYLSVVVLSTRALRLRGRRAGMLALWMLPLYWLLMAVACVRALVQILVKPHLWEKTPHRGRTQRKAAGRPHLDVARPVVTAGPPTQRRAETRLRVR